MENSLVYKGERGMPGVYISSVPLSEDKPYFEIEISKTDSEAGEGSGPVIGLCSNRLVSDDIYIYSYSYIYLDIYFV